MFGLNRPVGTFVVDDVLYSLFDKPGIDLSVDTDMIDIVVDMTCHPYLSVVALYMYVQSDHYLTEPLSELYMYGQSDHYLAEPLSELNMYGQSDHYLAEPLSELDMYGSDLYKYNIKL
jgi:hypothetical protein